MSLNKKKKNWNWKLQGSEHLLTEIYDCNHKWKVDQNMKSTYTRIDMVIMIRKSDQKF